MRCIRPRAGHTRIESEFVEGVNDRAIAELDLRLLAEPAVDLALASTGSAVISAPMPPIPMELRLLG